MEINLVKKEIRCGCWAHARRKFVEALPTDEKLLPTSKAAEGVLYCNKIFALEREYEELPSEERQCKRQEYIKPVLDEFYSWLEAINPSGGTKLASAVQYAKNEKSICTVFLTIRISR